MFKKIENFMNRLNPKADKSVNQRERKTQEVLDKSAEAREFSRRAVEEAYNLAAYAIANPRKNN